MGSADIDQLVAAFSPSAPTASVTSSKTTSSGSAGQTIDGGTLTLTNTGGLPETVSTVILNVSDPALFSFLSLSASVDGGSDQAAVSGPLGNTVTFIFVPALTVPARSVRSNSLALTRVSDTLRDSPLRRFLPEIDAVGR